MNELEVQTAGMKRVSELRVSHSCYIFHSRHEIFSLKRHFLFVIVTGFKGKKRRGEKKRKNPALFKLSLLFVRKHKQVTNTILRILCLSPLETTVFCKRTLPHFLPLNPFSLCALFLLYVKSYLSNTISCPGQNSSVL